MIQAMHKPLTGRHVFYALLSFFGVVVAVNMAFLYFAVESHPGVITDDAYRKGLDYNGTLRAAAAQHVLGWRGDLTVAPGSGGRTNRYALTLSVRDANAKPVSGLTITGQLRRPAIDTADRSVAFDERQPGDYVAEIDLPYRGNWVASISGHRRDGTAYRLDERLWLK